MSGFDLSQFDYGGDNSTDYLGSISGDLSNVGGTAPYDTNYVDYSNPSYNTPYTIDNTYSQYTTPAFGGLSQANDSGGSSGGFWNNLLDQFGKIKDNAVKNPLGALATALGAYGGLKESTGGNGNSVNAVDQLMMKGQLQNAFTPQPVAYGKPVAHDPRRYMQQYNEDGTVKQDHAGDISDLYKEVLGRGPDEAGADYWNQTMAKTGMTPDQLKHELFGSNEAQVNNAYHSLLGRGADYGGMQYWMNALNNHTIDPATMQQYIKDSPEYQSHMVSGGLTQAGSK